MSSFTTPLIVEKLDSWRHWRIVQSFTYQIGELDGPERIDVPIGFVTDFGSVPRGLWNIIPPTGKAGKAYVIHDWMYQNGGITWTYTIQSNDPNALPVAEARMRYPTREEADGLLLEAMGALGVNFLTKRVVYWGVRCGGAIAWRRGHRPKPA